MNFERHKEGKESLGIGLKANAQQIRNLYYLEYEVLNSITGMQRRSPIVISDLREVFRVLQEIEMGEADPNDFAVDVETSDQIGSLEPLWRHRGKWFKFRANGFQSVSVYDDENGFTEREIIFQIPPEV